MSSSRLPDWLSGPQMFDDSTEGKRRSVLFTIGVVTGFIAVTAAAAVIVSSQHVPTVVLLILVGALAFVFAGMVSAGRLETLVSDDELLWKLFGDD